MKKILQQIGDGGILFISTLIVNAANYGINLFLGRFLGPSAFAEANLLATLVLVISFVAVGLQLATTKFVAGYQAKNDTSAVQAVLSLLSKNTMKGIGVLTIALILATPAIASFLNFESNAPLYILFIGIPLYFQMSIHRGYYQGMVNFRKLAYTYLIEMLGRLLPTIGLLFLAIKLNWTITSEVVAFGFFISFLLSYLFSKIQVEAGDLKKIDTTPILRFLGIVGIYELSQILINNSDVILVKHFFSAEEAGLYASLALIGRVVYFATWTLVTLLFPKVIEKEAKGEPHQHLFYGALSIVGGIGLVITAFCFFGGQTIVGVLFGKAYLSIAPLLWKYAMATTLFACANVFAYYHMSLNKYIPVGLSLVAGVAQIIGISMFHLDLLQVLHVQVYLMSFLFIGMLCIHQFYQNRKEFSKELVLSKMANK